MKKMFAIVLALMLCVSVLSVVSFAAEGDFVVHVAVDSETAPNAWAWGDYGNAFSAWPGEPMVKNGDWWEITVPAGTTGFIVNNGSAQTADITISGETWINVAADFSAFEIVEAPAGETPEVPEQPPVETPEEKPEEKPVDPNASYYVAGVGALCGSEWKENDEANKMTYADGVFSITYKNVAAGNYSLKVTDGTWTNSWGGNGENGNFDFEVKEASDVTVKFDASKKQVSIVIGDEVIDGPAQAGDVSLAGVSLALLAATAGLVVVVSKKKEF